MTTMHHRARALHTVLCLSSSLSLFLCLRSVVLRGSLLVIHKPQRELSVWPEILETLKHRRWPPTPAAVSLSPSTAKAKKNGIVKRISYRKGTAKEEGDWSRTCRFENDDGFNAQRRAKKALLTKHKFYCLFPSASDFFVVFKLECLSLLELFFHKPFSCNVKYFPLYYIYVFIFFNSDVFIFPNSWCTRAK